MSLPDAVTTFPCKPASFLAPQERTLLNNREGTVFAPNWLPEYLKQWPGWLRKDPDNPKKPIFRTAKGRWVSREWNKPQNQAAWSKALPPSGRAGVHARDGLVVIDFDRVIDPETGHLLEPVVRDTLEILNTYASYSGSGTGVHIFVRSSNEELQRKHNLCARPSRDDRLGEWLGNSFVALTGVAIPEYADRSVIELSTSQERFVFANLLASTQQSDEASNSGNRTCEGILGVIPTPDYLTYFRTLLSWRQPLGMQDITHSGWNRYWLRAYFQGDKAPTFQGALKLSYRFEHYFDNHGPDNLRYARNKKPRAWHQEQVLKAAVYVQEKGRLVFTDDDPDYLATPYELQAGQLLKHLVSNKTLTSTAMKLFCVVVTQANGRNIVAISDQQMAVLMACNRKTVGRAKNQLRRHSCLTIDRSQQVTTYKLHFENPCTS